MDNHPLFDCRLPIDAEHGYIHKCRCGAYWKRKSNKPEFGAKREYYWLNITAIGARLTQWVRARRP